MKRLYALDAAFSAVPAMRRLQLPDSSHANHWDAPVFTESLLDALVEAGMFEGEALGSDAGAREDQST